MAETKVATKNTIQAPATQQPKGNTLKDLVQSYRGQFEAALPKHLDSERFVRIALTEITKNPKLKECSKETFMGALMTSAQLGLEPGMLGQCYLIPFKKKDGTVDCNLQIGYKGLIELLRRTGQLSDIYGYPVYKGDKLTIKYGLDRTLEHEPNFEIEREEKDITGFYMVAILKDGTRAFEYMSLKEVLAHETKYRKGNFKNEIWVKNLIEMALKTVCKKMLKWLPVSVEMVENLRKDFTTSTLDTKTGEVETKDYEEDYINIDTETGEVLKEESNDPKVPKVMLEAFIARAEKENFDFMGYADTNGIDVYNLSLEDFNKMESALKNK